MAVRCTPEDVEKVLQPGNDYDGESDLNVWIASASSLVDTVVSVGATHGRLGLTLSTDQKKQLEVMLAAAMYCFSDQQYKTSNAGKSNTTFRGNDGDFLESNMYGRLACMIDVTRVLKPLVEGRIAGFVWLGKKVSDQIPYSQRS